MALLWIVSDCRRPSRRDRWYREPDRRRLDRPARGGGGLATRGRASSPLTIGPHRLVAAHFPPASFQTPPSRRSTLVKRTVTCIARPVRASAKSSVRV